MSLSHSISGSRVDAGTIRKPAKPVHYAPVIASYAYGLALAAVIGHFVFSIPVQFSDSYGNMLFLEAGWRELMGNEFSQRAYLRPLLWAQLKLVYDVSGGQYFEWFRGVHVAQLFGLAVLYLGLVRPAAWRDAALVPLGFAVVVGMHTFKGTVDEAFPINTFMTILLCCGAAANLVLMRHRWWVDVLALLVFVVAALTVETGLLVAVIVIGGAFVGGRGVSKPAQLLLVAMMAGYVLLRFAVFDVGTPGLSERASGFGFSRLEPSELAARFGDNPLPFYAYNIVTSISSVLFAEPRDGMFGFVHGLLAGGPRGPRASAVINVVASTCATAVIVSFAWRRRRIWRARQFERDDQLVLLFVMVLLANAAISYPYTKDVIMSPAGLFLAAAVFAAGRHMLSAGAPVGPASRIIGCTTLCAILGVTWAIRVVGLSLHLGRVADQVRTEWAYAEPLPSRPGASDVDVRARALLRTLQTDAIIIHPPRRGLRFGSSVFETD